MLANVAIRLSSRGTRPLVRAMSTTKVQEAFEAYRQSNFSQTLSSRFAKQVVDAADTDKDGVLTKDEIVAVMKNIDAFEPFLTNADIELFLTESAGADGSLSTEELITILQLYKDPMTVK